MDGQWIATCCKRDPVLRYLEQTFGSDRVSELLSSAPGSVEKTLEFMRTFPQQDKLPQPLGVLVQSPNAEALLKSLVFARVQTLARLESLEERLRLTSLNCEQQQQQQQQQHLEQLQDEDHNVARTSRRASWQGTPIAPLVDSDLNLRRPLSVRKPSLSAFDPFWSEGRGTSQSGVAEDEESNTANAKTFKSGVDDASPKSDLIFFSPKPKRERGHVGFRSSSDGKEHASTTSVLTNFLASQSGPSPEAKNRHLAA